MEDISQSTAIITAAGSGTRMGGTIKKQFRSLGGIPVFIRSLSVFLNCPLISNILITAPEDDIALCESLINDFLDQPEKPLKVIPGGAERQDSIFGALQACPPDTDYVFIHDGVRPFITVSFLEELYRRVIIHQAVVPAAPLKHTVKQVSGNLIQQTLNRSHLVQVYTPQVFNYHLIHTCYQKAYEDGFFSTDDASILEYCGEKVYILPSSELNLKITDETDWFLANLIVDKNF